MEKSRQFNKTDEGDTITITHINTNGPMKGSGPSFKLDAPYSPLKKMGTNLQQPATANHLDQKLTKGNMTLKAEPEIMIDGSHSQLSKQKSDGGMGSHLTSGKSSNARLNNKLMGQSRGRSNFKTSMKIDSNHLQNHSIGSSDYHDSKAHILNQKVQD